VHRYQKLLMPPHAEGGRPDPGNDLRSGQRRPGRSTVISNERESAHELEECFLFIRLELTSVRRFNLVYYWMLSVAIAVGADLWRLNGNSLT
jgi:hypothetical protein